MLQPSTHKDAASSSRYDSQLASNNCSSSRGSGYRPDQDISDEQDDSQPRILGAGSQAKASSVSINADISEEYDISTSIRPRSRIWAMFGNKSSSNLCQQVWSPFGGNQANINCPHDRRITDLVSQTVQGNSETEPLLHHCCDQGKRPRGSPTNVSLRKSRQGSVCSTADLQVLDTSPNSTSASGDEILSSTDSHCHSNNKKGSFDKKARTRLILASILCMVFMIGEMVGGLLAHSLAIISDAAHLLTDFASFMISLMALYLAHRPATKKLSFGWYRIEILGAFVSILMLWVLTGILVYSAVLRIMEDNYEINATVMLITAATGVAFNVVLGLTLHQHGHSHGGGHGHSHGGEGHAHESHGHAHGGHGHSNDTLEHSNEHTSNHTSKPTKESQTLTSSGRPNYGSFREIESADHVDPTSHFSDNESDDHKHVIVHKPSNINVKAAFIHVLGDLFQSIGVLVAAFIIFYKPEWKIADPICTFLFSLFVLVTTITIMRDIVVVLMEGTPRGINFTEVRNTFFEVAGVLDIHNLRVWSLTMDKIALSVHLAVDKQSDPHRVLKSASMAIKQRFNISETTMQIEEYVTEMIDCQDCQGPQL